MLALFGACGFLVASSMVVRSKTPPEHYCLAFGMVSVRRVELDGRLFSIGGTTDEAELRRGCSHYTGAVILPNCDAWENLGGMRSHRIGKVGPFYTDGTCDGSGGGTRLASAPPEIVDSGPRPPG
ncbi:MAG: hypothetical protein ABI658_18290 [Acidimicrobiales bacterium]